jgi:DNA-binding transcriptional MerR regulator
VSKGPEAFRTISEVADALDLPQHVLRFWETRFAQIKPLKRGGGRRYYRPDDVDLLRGIRQLLYGEGFTIKGVQRILKEQGPRFVISAGRGELDGKAALAGRSGQEDLAIDYQDDFYPDGGDEAEAPAGRGGQRVQDVEVSAIDAPENAGSVAPARDRADMTRTGAGRLSGAEVKVLKATLEELLECRRLLDETL